MSESYLHSDFDHENNYCMYCGEGPTAGLPYPPARTTRAHERRRSGFAWDYCSCGCPNAAHPTRSGEGDELRDIILDGGLRVPGFDHWRERASSKPSDPDDTRWDCVCGYSGSSERVKRHWASLRSEDEA